MWPQAKVCGWPSKAGRGKAPLGAFPADVDFSLVN